MADALIAAATDREQEKIAERLKAKSQYYEVARELARLASRCEPDEEGKRHFVVCSGGGPSIMEAANRGAADEGRESIGLNIVLPHEQMPNPYVTPGLSFQFHYFALRKMHFLLRARAVAVFPGGFGTFDEMFELLTLIQTGKVKPMPILFFGRDFWKRVVNFEALAEEGVIAPHDLDLIHWSEDAQEAWDFVTQFLRRRHPRRREPSQLRRTDAERLGCLVAALATALGAPVAAVSVGLPAACAGSIGSFSAFWGPLFGPVPGFGGGCVGRPRQAPPAAAWAHRYAELRKAMTSARSCGLLRPAKVILVPGANACGLVSHWLRLSQFQVPPFFDSASEKAKPLPCPIGSPITPHRFGPSWFGPPLSALWQAAHLLKTCWPLAGSALAR